MSRIRCGCIISPQTMLERPSIGGKAESGDKWESQHGKLRVVWLVVGSYTLVLTVIKTR
jgi:hypothetical protein